MNESGREIIASAILETPFGVLTVQDRKEEHRNEIIYTLKARVTPGIDEAKLKRINYLIQSVQNGRFRVPGGPIVSSDKENAGIGTDVDLQSLSPDSPEFIGVIRESVIRNVQRELGLVVDRASVTNPIMRIEDRNKDHLICFAVADGQVEIDKNNLTGIGFLDRPSALPVSPIFLTEPAIKIYQHYIRSPQREPLVMRHQSKISVGFELIDEWYMSMYRAYMALSKSRKKNVERPSRIPSSPNLKIVQK